MKKLKLTLADVDVESFSVTPTRDLQPTIVGHQSGQRFGCGDYTYDPIAMDCVSYAEPCEASWVPTNCTASDPTAYVCDGCRDSVTACA